MSPEAWNVVGSLGGLLMLGGMWAAGRWGR
jgi:hypothetical protein